MGENPDESLRVPLSEKPLSLESPPFEVCIYGNVLIETDKIKNS